MLNSRTHITEKADNNLRTLLSGWIAEHDLTWLEAIALLMDASRRWMKYPLRDERHGDLNKKADEA